ncbi:MAG: ATP-dependent protease, partial [Thermoplasmata archaeon]
MEKCKVPVEKLRRVCPAEWLDFETTNEVKPLEGRIGQDRGVDAIRFGISIPSEGYNIYVAGAVGTGRLSTVLNIVKDKARGEQVPDDWCYVNNFKEPDAPRAIRLPAGKGREFARDMDELIADCRSEIPKAFESEEYEHRKNEALEAIQEKRAYLLSSLEEKAARLGFSIRFSKAGVVSIPVMDGRELSPDEFERLPQEQKERIEANGEKLQEEVAHVLSEIRKLEKESKERIRELDRQIALFAAGHLLDNLRRKYKDHADICEYLDEVQQDIINNIETFKQGDGEAPEFLGIKLPPIQSRYDEYRVNLLVDNSRTEGAPVIVERNPTYDNLFGRLEYKGRFGTMVTDFHMIKAGAVHRANGGYLILQALDVLKNPFAWDGLKRIIRAGEVRIESPWEQFRSLPVATLRPEPIPVNVKVIMIGSTFLYHLLYLLDEDFQRLFKVKSQFDVEMDWNLEHTKEYAAFVSLRCKEGDLLPFDKSAVAAVIEYGSWLAGDQQKLSTRFLQISDVIHEASYWAREAKSDTVRAEHVLEAISQKNYRSNMVEEKIQRLIEEGTLLIDTDGQVEGQVNGLAIYDLGDFEFGKPSRITATVSLGTKGVVNIEREAKMSGKIHSKGVMILSAYLARKFGHDKPLCLSASLCFEQLYDEVEGDSASSTELYALLSSLAGVPLKQNLAVTGSVNQKGEIQPVGGVTRKIEGFFDVCKRKGLTGDQGVIIPQKNVRNLMLRNDVVEAVKEGKFHIYAIQTVEEGIELLT